MIRGVKGKKNPKLQVKEMSRLQDKRMMKEPKGLTKSKVSVVIRKMQFREGKRHNSTKP